jgi:hypothetical protein
MIRRIRCATGCILAVLSCSRPAAAQSFSGTIVGRVIDPQKAGVADASVTLRSADTAFERHTLSSSQGEYLFELVPPGRFQLLAEHAGFATTVLNLEVVVATPLRADVILRVQPIEQQLRVVGEGGVAVQTENADLGRVISPHEMTELPSLGRSLYDFIGLMAGATLSNDDLGVGFSLNGGRTQSANYLLDGAENNEIMMSAPAMDVPLDSVQEFNVQTNHFSPEYGRDSGFIANIVTRSGTNNFHGSIYDYVRNSALAANTFNNNANNLPRAVFNRHQFGGTAGGPLRKDKLFFFASVEEILVRSSGPTSFFVPTPQLLAISAPGTQAIFARYPLPGKLSSTNVRTETLCPYATSCNAETEAGYVTIPAFAFTTRIGPQDFGAGPPQNTVLATGRLDWTAGPNTQAFLHYAIDNEDEFAVAYQPYSSELDQPLYGHNQNLSVNVIHTFSPRFATETRFAFDRVTGDPDRGGGDAYPVPTPLLPSFSILNETATLPGGTYANFGPTNGYQFFETATYSRANHTLRFGGQFVHLRQNITFGTAGEVANAQFATAQDLVDATLQFYSIALDPKGHFPGEYVDPPFGPPSFTRHYHYNEPAFFIADTWKITARWVLTPGLRWEYFGVLHSPGAEHDLDSNFYPGAGSTVLEQIASGHMMRTVDAPGELQGRFYLPDYKNFAPRLGVAYDLTGDGKTVIRAGAGIFYDRWVGWELFRAYQNPPGYSVANLSNIPLTPAMVTNQYAAFPNAPVKLSKSSTQDPDLHMQTAYVASWNATIERELAANFVIGASYLGSSGSNLYSGNNVNRAGSGGLLDASCVTPRIASDGITPIGPDYTGCPRLNPNISNITSRANDGHSSFNALQLRIDSKPISRLGLEFGANYTWSHSIDNRSVSGLSDAIGGSDSGYLDAFDPSLDRGSSDFDVRHRIAAHFVWAIPPRAASHDRVGRFLLQNWEVSSFLSYQTGQPFSLADLGTPDRTAERTRPRLTGALPRTSLIPDALSGNSYLYLPINEVYDPLTGLCIARAAPFACEISVNGPFEGTLSRNTFRQPGLFFWNTALIKNFPLPREKMKLQIRAEFYNLLNHPNLYVNQGSTDVSTASFTNSSGQLIPGVTASFADNREIVLAAKLFF